MFPVRERFIPNLGTLYSHLGNVSFPYWEYYKNTPQRSVEFELGHAAWLVPECTRASRLHARTYII